MTSLTELVVRAPDVVVTTADLSAVRDALRRQLHHPAANGVDLDVRPDVVRDPSRALGSDPFRWSPATVRRSLGLASLDACASGRYRTPAEAVASVADAAVTAWLQTGWRQFHWEPWLARLGLGARSAVLAEATTWASLLWTMLDWRWLATEDLLHVGPPLRRVTFSGRPVVRLRARPDVRIGRRDIPPTPPGGAQGPSLDEPSLAGCQGRAPLPPALPTSGPGGVPSEADGAVGRADTQTLVVAHRGAPPSTWRAELALVALVDLLAGTPRPTSRRVVGLWPEAGAARWLDFGQEELELGARAVSDVVDAAVGSSGAPSPHATARTSSSRQRVIASGSTGDPPTGERTDGTGTADGTGAETEPKNRQQAA